MNDRYRIVILCLLFLIMIELVTSLSSPERYNACIDQFLLEGKDMPECHERCKHHLQTFDQISINY